MAIGFRNQTQIASGGATNPTSAAALPASTGTGDMVLSFVIVKYASTTLTDPSGWTSPSNNQGANSTLTDSGNDAGNVRAAIHFREKDAGWSTMPAYALSGTPNITMVGAIAYTKAAGEVWIAPECAFAVDNTVSSTGVDPPASGTTISLRTGDLMGSFAAQNGDVGTFASHNLAVSGITFGAQTTRLGAATSGGTDLRGHSVERPYSSGTAGGGPDGSMLVTTGGGSDAGVMVFYRLRVAIGGVCTGAATASGTASGLRTVTATGAGAATASGVATGKRTVLASSTGAATASGVATSKRTVLASSAGSATASGTATGAPTRAGAATGAATASGTATGLRTVLASATGAAVGAGTASGTAGSPTVTGTATGAATASGVATGKRTVTGVATGTVGGPVSIYLGSTPVSRIYINP